MNATATAEHYARPNLEGGLGLAGQLGFGAAIVAALGYVAYSVFSDANAAGVSALAFLPFALLFLALLIALGFEFVNGFHDTANAVATVIYTNAMPANVAVVWSGFFNFLGVLLSTGAVAFGIVSLLPVELILQVGSGAGFAMVFALLIAAILWNLATWWLGIPSSSSHTLIGSIIGVGVANAIMHGKSGTAGVDWTKATEIGQALLISPLVGFGLAALLFLALKVLVKNKELYQEPKGDTPPPLWIRALLIFTCTGVSFAHGSNDGQKGMGLIMLILIGTVPTAYALNRAVPASYTQEFHTGADAAYAALGGAPTVDLQPAAARIAVTRYIADKTFQPGTTPALAVLVKDIDRQVDEYGSLAKVPAAATENVRNDMYLASEGIKRLAKDKGAALNEGQAEAINGFKKSLDGGTRFIPTWVKVAVAFALGLGTMVGWKRIVVTVGEKIGKTHLTYVQGASAELGDGHDLRGRPPRPAGFDHPCPVLGRGGHDGRQRLGPADEHRPQHADGLGADAAGVDPARGRALRPVLADLLTRERDTGEPLISTQPGAGPGLVWGLDFAPDGSQVVVSCDSAFRWLHFNLADHGSRMWIEQAAMLPPGARELLLATDTHQRALVDGGAACCILHDFERDFDVRDTARVGALRVAVLPDLIVTARRHPLGSADLVISRIRDGARIDGPAGALDLLIGALSQNIDTVVRGLSHDVQAAEDAFLDGHDPPTSRALLGIRRRLAQIHRMLDGAQRVFRRLEQDDELPGTLQSTVEKLSQRLQGLDADALAVQGQLRLLRDELDLQSNQRTNQNLYVLSLMTALMLPATLVTGLFGMNTGGLPFTGAQGTLAAAAVAAGTALATYLFLRSKGFFP